MKNNFSKLVNKKNIAFSVIALVCIFLVTYARVLIKNDAIKMIII